MARYGRDFMGRVRGMWNQLSHGLQQERGGQQGRGQEGHGRRPMQATGPGGEGYFLSPNMARDARYTMDYDRGWDDVGDRGFPPSGMAQFGRAGAGRGYGGDYRTGRGGSDAGEFFVNRGQGGDTGYHTGYQRDLGMQGGGMARGGRGYGGDYARGGSPMRYGGGYAGGGGSMGYDRGYQGGGSAGGYDRGYQAGQPNRSQRYSRDFRDRDDDIQSYYIGTYRP
ncbi:MAG TPA: hypothetical protein VLK84_32715 [Longimicrobium sp.]|nr:hypothetical protein [Longimicrobium sp.]